MAKTLWASYRAVGKAIAHRFYFRGEILDLIKISQSTFYRYVRILESEWSELFNYTPRQRQWTQSQVHYLTCLYYLFQKKGLTEKQVRQEIQLYGLPPLDEVTEP